MFGVGKYEELIVMLTILGVLVLDVAMIVRVLNNERIGTIGKMLWVLAIILISPFAALYYVYWADLYRRRSPQPQD